MNTLSKLEKMPLREAITYRYDDLLMVVSFAVFLSTLAIFFLILSL